MSATSDPAIAACSSDVESLGTALAIPIAVHVSVTSSLPVDVHVNMNSSNWYTLDNSSGTYRLNPVGLSTNVLWAENGSDGPSCHQFGETSTIGNITWSALASHASGSWSGAFIVEDAVTPNDPQGLNSEAYKLLLGRTLLFYPSGVNSTGFVQAPHGVECAGEPEIAVSTAAALRSGCTALSADATQSQEPPAQASSSSAQYAAEFATSAKLDASTFDSVTMDPSDHDAQITAISEISGLTVDQVRAAIKANGSSPNGPAVVAAQAALVAMLKVPTNILLEHR